MKPLKRLWANIAAELRLPAGEVSIMFAGDRGSSQVHLAIFGDPTIPNVVTQRLASNDEAAVMQGEAIIGEICINVMVARQEATLANIEPIERVFELGVHGLLHLVGYDHETDQGQMYKKQAQIMKKYGVQLMNE